MSIRCWVGTWNVGVTDPFIDGDDELIGARESNEILESFIPHGCQIYAFGIQEGTSDQVFRAVDIFLNQREHKFRRMPLDKTDDKVFGYGDGAFKEQKYTGLAIFLSDEVFDRISLIKCHAHGFGPTQGSKGGVSVALRVDGKTTLAFLSCHLDANNDDLRREQIKKLDSKMGSKLGEIETAPLTQQFDHVIWIGDLNYRLHTLSPDEILEMLADGKVKELENGYDGLLRDMKENKTFQGFNEPRKTSTFYPSYKKIKNRGFVDTTANKNWPTLMYSTRYPVPIYKQIYKGKRTMTRNPGWTDRILVHSLPSCNTQFIPEEISNNGTVSDNYRAIDNGLGMDISDHSPVFCTFNLVHVKVPLTFGSKMCSHIDKVATQGTELAAKTDQNEVGMSLKNHE